METKKLEGNKNKMNNWIEYKVPKKHTRLYVSHILKNVFILVFFLLLGFGVMPSSLSFWIIVLMSDATFYHAIKSTR